MSEEEREQEVEAHGYRWATSEPLDPEGASEPDFEAHGYRWASTEPLDPESKAGGGREAPDADTQ